ncbi:hypothetical protein EWM64_g7783 [Hericium alpestre]|uniref:HTH CENPB-type domain-containing protein n=1 Tax=Hericium alpestre TaxID=135208 RepID=A0A4Y9ZPQ2_9AGAM|nr:hypothetical protein EWM64_g7783 [Hericium alpestre]
MPYKAKSKSQQQRGDSDAKEERLLLALDAYRENASKPPNESRGLKAVATSFRVSPTTLRERYNGRQSMKTFNAGKKHLTSMEEAILVDFIITMSKRMLPPTHQLLTEKAEAILTVNHSQDPAIPGTLGRNWSYRFLERHDDQLATYWGAEMDNKRGRALNPTNLREYFEVVQEIQDLHHTQEMNKHAADETGIILGTSGRKERVVGAKGAGASGQKSLHDGNRESVTMLVTIRADGQISMAPTIIFKGQRFLSKWSDTNVLDASIAIGPNGYIDDELAYQWIQDFEQKTRPDDPAEWRLLAVDSVGSHITHQVLEFAHTHKIDMIGYPPHSTNWLQGLDVICFGTFKTLLGKARREHEALGKAITKETFLEFVEAPFRNTFIPSTIRAAFRRTGLHPINPDAVPSDAMKPSEETSHQSFAPFVYPKPVQLVIPLLESAMRMHEHNESPSTPGLDEHLVDQAQRPPLTPRSLNIDPQLLSPQSQAEATCTHLQQTDAAFVMQPAQSFTSSCALPAPVYQSNVNVPAGARNLLAHDINGEAPREELVQEIEVLQSALSTSLDQQEVSNEAALGSNAQTVLMHLAFKNQNQQLHAKEQKRKSRKDRMLPTKLGRYLTGPGLRGGIGLDLREREAAESVKRLARNTKALKKRMMTEKKDWRIEEQERRKDVRQNDLRAHNLECDLAHQRKEKIPKRPRAPKRQATPERFQVSISEYFNDEKQAEVEEMDTEAEDVQ